MASEVADGDVPAPEGLLQFLGILLMAGITILIAVALGTFVLV